MTTNIDTLMRNLDVKNLILAGALTDQCVESAVRDACDLNYLVTLVTGDKIPPLQMAPLSRFTSSFHVPKDPRYKLQ